jgi:hypothetical protein
VSVCVGPVDWKEPTAMQPVVLVHATLVSVANVRLPGFGLTASDHAEPFQRSMSVFGLAPVVTSPTAKQLVVLGHETLAKLLTPAPEGFGLETTDHCVPFQRSTRVFVDPTA